MAIYKRLDDNDVVVDATADETRSGAGVASSFIWAISSIIIVLILVWAIFFSGFFDRMFNSKKRIDINVDAPAVNTVR